MAEELSVQFEELVKITGTDDLYRLDSELDHMRSIELLVPNHLLGNGGGFTASDNLDANITPSALALNLYYRTHSTRIDPKEFWGDQLKPYNPKTASESETNENQNESGDSLK